MTSWLPFAHLGAHVQYQPPFCFLGDKTTTVPPPNTLISKSGSVRLGDSSDTLIPWEQLPAPTQMSTLKAGPDVGVVTLAVPAVLEI